MSNRINMKYLDVFKSKLVKNAVFSDKYNFPIINPTFFVPETLIPFDKANKTNNFNQFVHFYIDDYRFERIWNSPSKYLPMLKKFDGVITPDFSIYHNMPIAMQIWNTYRNRALSYWMQQNGINIIPNIRWGSKDSYNFCFEGIKPGGNLAISSHGTIKNKKDRQIFSNGIEILIETLKPNKIINYSYAPKDIWNNYSNYLNDLIIIDNYYTTNVRGII